MLTVERATRMLIFINLLALGTELLIFAGKWGLQMVLNQNDLLLEQMA